MNIILCVCKCVFAHWTVLHACSGCDCICSARTHMCVRWSSALSPSPSWWRMTEYSTACTKLTHTHTRAHTQTLLHKELRLHTKSTQDRTSVPQLLDSFNLAVPNISHLFFVVFKSGCICNFILAKMK